MQIRWMPEKKVLIATPAPWPREAEAAKPREVIHISSAQLALLRSEGRLRFLFQLRES